MPYCKNISRVQNIGQIHLHFLSRRGAPFKNISPVIIIRIIVLPGLPCPSGNQGFSRQAVRVSISWCRYGGWLSTAVGLATDGSLGQALPPAPRQRNICGGRLKQGSCGWTYRNDSNTCRTRVYVLTMYTISQALGHVP